MQVLVPSARLAAWGGAVLRGTASIDEAVEHVSAGVLPETHRLLAPEGGDLSLALCFGWLHRQGVTALRVALPRPGDPAGVRQGPGGAAALAAAVEAGEAVITEGGPAAYVLVAQVAALGSSGSMLTWHAHEVDPARPGDQPSVAEADRELASSLGEATAELVRLDVARWRPEVAQALAGLRSPAVVTELPADYGPRASRLLASAQRVATIVELAAPDAGAAVSAAEVRGRSRALDVLARASRRAITAAVNSVLEDGATERSDVSRGHAAPEWGYSTER